MKIGAENKKQVRWMIALLAILLLVGIYNFRRLRHQFRGVPPAASTHSSRSQRKPARHKLRR